jgi:ferric-dicitrate binding protein FerR (iron transport regulator)
MFNFEHKPLKDIMQVLARWYDMDVIFDNAQLQDKRFNGLINKSYSIESILSMLKSSNSINTYEINNKTITLK